MKNRRFFSWKSTKNAAVCFCAVCAVVLCGCNTDNSGEEITKITYWSGNSHSKYVMAEFFNDYNRKQGKSDGIFIDYYVKDNEQIESLVKEALSSGKAPDFMGVYSEDIIENGYALAIENLPGGLSYLESFEDDDFKVKANGKTYAVRNGVCTQGMIYNKDMFRRAGIVDSNGEPTPPDTFDEMQEYARRLTNSRKNEYGMVLPMAWSGWFNSDVVFPAMSSCGFNLYNSQTEKVDYSTVKKIAQYYLDMRQDGSIMPGEMLINNDQARSQFAEGTIGMKMAFSFDVGVLNDQFVAKCDWDVAKYPTINPTVRYPSRMTYDTTGLMSAQALDTVGGFKMLKVFKLLTSDGAVIHNYKEGITIPADFEIIEKNPLDKNSKTGWKTFCDLVYDSKEDSKEAYPKYKTEHLHDLKDIFINEVWTGKRDLNEAFDSHEEAVNIAIEAYAEQDGNQ